MMSLPSETGMISVLEGASSRGLGAETLYRALDQSSDSWRESPRQNLRHVCESGTAFVDFVHC